MPAIHRTTGATLVHDAASHSNPDALIYTVRRSRRDPSIYLVDILEPGRSYGIGIITKYGRGRWYPGGLPSRSYARRADAILDLWNSWQEL